MHVVRQVIHRQQPAASPEELKGMVEDDWDPATVPRREAEGGWAAAEVTRHAFVNNMTTRDCCMQ